MTEAEWLESTDPMPMLEFLKGKASDRKLRLFAVSCCHRIRHLLIDERSHQAIDAAAQFADGLILEKDRETACSKSLEAATQIAKLKNQAEMQHWSDLRAANASTSTVQEDAWLAAFKASDQAARAEGIEKYGEIHDANRTRSVLKDLRIPQAQLLHDFFGNPFHPITLDPSWLTPTVPALAQKIYDDRTFDQMPLLADELEKAGCGNAEILDHCRGRGEHVRGCWVVDGLLGKR